MLHYYGVNVMPPHEDREAARPSYKISDSQGFTVHCKLCSRLWAGYNMAWRLHCCLTFQMIWDWCSISSTIFRLHAERRAKSMYFKQGIQLLHNHRFKLAMVRLALPFPSWSSISSSKSASKRSIAFHTLLLSIGNIFSAHCLKMLWTLGFSVSRIFRSHQHNVCQCLGLLLEEYRQWKAPSEPEKESQ